MSELLWRETAQCSGMWRSSADSESQISDMGVLSSPCVCIYPCCFPACTLLSGICHTEPSFLGFPKVVFPAWEVPPKCFFSLFTWTPGLGRTLCINSLRHVLTVSASSLSYLIIFTILIYPHLSYPFPLLASFSYTLWRLTDKRYSAWSKSYQWWR